MTKAVKKAKYLRLLESMSKGKVFSAKQIAATYKVIRPHNLIYSIRDLGVNVSSKQDPKTGAIRYFIA